MRLNNLTLSALRPAVSVPTYNRRAVTPGIVHIGVGGFHRAHEAVYLDDLMEQGTAKTWGVCGVGLRPADRAMRDALVPQDCLYTVLTRAAEGDSARVIGSIGNFLFAPDNPAAVLAQTTAPETRLVSMTITEGGYNLEDMEKDISGLPTTAFGFLAEALARRFQAGAAPFTVLSCDNVPHNGDRAREALLTAAARHGDKLTAWIERSVACPNSMVDRITPQTTDADRARVRAEFGIEDAWPVVTEPFRQWILEDKFSSGRPEWEQAGAQFVSDVSPYETMKLRLLNAGHSALGYPGFLAGFVTMDAVVRDPLFHRYVRQMMDGEVTPLLPPVPGIDLEDYKATLLTRFANPAIGDQVTRICLDGSAKMPKFLLPSLREARAAGRPHRLLTFAVASWLRYLTGTDEQGQEFTIEDPQAQMLRAKAREGGADPRPLLGLTSIFGDLGEDQTLVGQITKDLEALYSLGARRALEQALG